MVFILPTRLPVILISVSVLFKIDKQGKRIFWLQKISVHMHKNFKHQNKKRSIVENKIFVPNFAFRNNSLANWANYIPIYHRIFQTKKKFACRFTFFSHNQLSLCFTLWQFYSIDNKHLYWKDMLTFELGLTRLAIFSWMDKHFLCQTKKTIASKNINTKEILHNYISFVVHKWINGN